MTDVRFDIDSLADVSKSTESMENLKIRNSENTRVGLIHLD